MYAVMGNRQYTIEQADIESFRARGYDIIGDEGETIAVGIGKTVPYAQYQAALAKIAELEAGEQTDEFSDMTVDELRTYATANAIDLTGKNRKAEMLAKIREG